MKMENKYLVKLSTAIAVLLISVTTFAQTTGPITLDKVGYYQHGYNKDNTTLGSPDLPREVRDSVMVGSTMTYFVMPDLKSNKGYYDNNGNDYTKTNLTVSQFTWIYPTTYGSGAFVSGSTNTATGTSPYVKVAWSTAMPTGTVDTIRMVETPKEYNGVALPTGAVCPGEEVKIPVAVIPKPTIKFNQAGGTTAAICAAFDPGQLESGSNPYPVANFPLNVTTSSSQVRVKYTLKKDGVVVGNSDVSSNYLEATVSDLSKLPLKFDDFGAYEVTIREITDRIARKCDVTGTLSATSTENVFTYVVLPQPKSGKTYHIPNNY